MSQIPSKSILPGGFYPPTRPTPRPELPRPTPVPLPSPSPFPGPIAGPFPGPVPLPNPGPFPSPFPSPFPTPPSIKDRLLTRDRSAALADRQADQLEDIQQGVRNGTVSQDEAEQLLKQQAKVSDATARATSDGVITQAEAAQIRRLQAQADNSIFEATTSREFRPSVQDPALTERQAQQIATIAEGVRNGTLTGAEARTLLREQVGIAQSIDRAQDGFGNDPWANIEVMLRQWMAGNNIQREKSDFQQAPHGRRINFPINIF
ncbi:MAG TPA: hypothetical protein VF815_35245 [Myxococcaceae bacterium]|jgi:hypothetical protein